MTAYTVKAGDTLSGIAKTYNTTTLELARLNELDNPNLLKPGMSLYVPDGHYIVEAGDTLGVIAKKYGLSVVELAAFNDIDDVNLIKVGQEIKLPTEAAPLPPPLLQKNDWPADNTAALIAFYGNPAGVSGGASASWEKQNIVNLIPPYTMYYPHSESKKRVQQISIIKIHRKCADSLERCLMAIGRLYTPDEIRRYELDLYLGAYNFRRIRGSNRLSTHAYGCSIDLSSLLNPWKKRYVSGQNMMPEGAVKIFHSEGWTWGGYWNTPDPMHFQAADT